MILTDIQITKRGRYSLFVDKEFLFSVHPEVFIRRGLVVGQTVTVELLEEIRLDSEERSAKEQALNLLSHSAKTSGQLYEKLCRRSDPDAAATAVARMQELGLVDDDDYAQRFIADKKHLKGWGKKRILVELRRKGLSDEVIEHACEGQWEDEAERLSELIERRYTPLPDDPKKRSAFVAKLMRMGYEYEIIRQVLRLYDED